MHAPWDMNPVGRSAPCRVVEDRTVEQAEPGAEFASGGLPEGAVSLAPLNYTAMNLIRLSRGARNSRKNIQQGRFGARRRTKSGAFSERRYWCSHSAAPTRRWLCMVYSTVHDERSTR